MTKKLLTFVGRTPEVTMQTQLTSAVKKAPGNPFVRVKPGVFGLLRYPELTAEEKAAAAAEEKAAASPKAPKRERDEAAEGEGPERSGRRRRRRGGRARTGKADEAAPTEAKELATEDTGADDAIEEPNAGGLSAAARAAALAETGVLEGDDESEGGDDEDQDDHDHDELSAEDESSPLKAAEGGTSSAGGQGEGEGAAEDEGEGDEDEPGEGGADEAAASGAPAEAGEEGGRRRRRRRRRRRGGDDEGARTGEAASAGGERPSGAGERGSFGEPQAGQPGESGESGTSSNGDTAGQATSAGGGSTESSAGDNQSARKIMTPVDAAIEVLRGQPPGRGVHVRQLADSAIRRRLIHGEPNEAWRVIRTALATEPKERLRSGQRPRVRAAGSGLYALARRTPDAELEKAEQVFGDARRALRERTMAAIERRLADLAPGAFEAVARVLLQREGFGPTTFVKRVEGTIYVEALRGRGSRPSKCLIALRAGGSVAGRRAIGELRAGIRARNHDEGLLMLAGRLGDDAIAEWKQPGPPLEIADGSALAETCVRHGVGVVSASVSVDFVDADFFAELTEG